VQNNELYHDSAVHPFDEKACSDWRRELHIRRRTNQGRQRGKLPNRGEQGFKKKNVTVCSDLQHTRGTGEGAEDGGEKQMTIVGSNP